MNASRRTIRVLIVENEPAAALLLEGLLEELGFDDVHVTYDLAAARDELGLEPPGLAILGFNVGQRPIFPLAERLRADNVPVLFSTGQPLSEFPPEWSDRPYVPKPLDKRMLNAALQRLGFVNN